MYHIEITIRQEPGDSKIAASGRTLTQALATLFSDITQWYSDLEPWDDVLEDLLSTIAEAMQGWSWDDGSSKSAGVTIDYDNGFTVTVSASPR
jgi:hypothetical protein